MESNFLRRSLVVVAISLIPFVGLGASIMTAPVAGAVMMPHTVQTHDTSGPFAVVSGYAMCDVTPYGYPGNWMVQYLFTTSGVVQGYSLSTTVTGYSPITSFVGSASGLFSPNVGGYVTQFEVPGLATKASVTLKFVWSGIGLPVVTQYLSTEVTLNGGCVASEPNTDLSPVVGITSTTDGQGYWLARANGQVVAFGDAKSYGEVTGSLNQPIVGIAATTDGKGYYLVARDGGIFAFGDAVFYGSMGGKPLNQPMVGITSTPDGGGYWTVAADGGIFSYGNARFYGSTGALTLNQPVVGMASVGSRGYYLVARDGGIFAFGRAQFLGSMGNQTLNRFVVGMSVDPGGGYREVATDGGVFSFGNAAYYGSTGAVHLSPSIVGMANTPSGHGYWFVADDGEVFGFGDAGNHS